MNDSIGALCIGGPLGGQRKEMPAGKTRFDVMEMEALPRLSALPQDYPQEIPATRRITYVTQDWNTPEGKAVFWVPSDQTAMQTLEILAASFEAQSIKKRKTRK